METAQVREDSVGQDGRDGQTQVLPGGQAVVQEHAQPAGEPAAQQGGVGLRLQQSGSNHLHQGATGVNEVAAVQDDARPSGFPDNINYETPRSQVSRRSMIPSPISAADGPSPSALPRALKWITGIGEYFNIRSVGESFGWARICGSVDSGSWATYYSAVWSCQRGFGFPSTDGLGFRIKLIVQCGGTATATCNGGKCPTVVQSFGCYCTAR